MLFIIIIKIMLQLLNNILFYHSFKIQKNEFKDMVDISNNKRCTNYQMTIKKKKSSKISNKVSIHTHALK